MKYTLHTGDCIEFMRAMDPESVDILFTSPPYNVKLQYNKYKDDMGDEDYTDWAINWITQAYRVMAEGARAYIVLSDRLLFEYKEICEVAGFDFAQILTWCKPNLAGGSKIGNDWNYMTEQILLVRKGKRTPMTKGVGNTHSYFEIPSPQTNWKHERKYHPAQFPLELVRRILSRTPGQVVFDPFCGAGSVGVVCQFPEIEREFIGCDLDASYIEIARMRIERAQGRHYGAFDGLPMFADMG